MSETKDIIEYLITQFGEREIFRATDVHNQYGGEMETLRKLLVGLCRLDPPLLFCYVLVPEGRSLDDGQNEIVFSFTAPPERRTPEPGEHAG